MTELPDWVRKEIGIVQAGRSSALNLSASKARKNLLELPEEIFALTGLEELIAL